MLTDHHQDISYRRILALAWPASIASSITPLLGAIDVWALGQSPRPLAIAAVGLAATLFSLAYWTCGFIRMSVAGLTAQAIGANDFGEARLAFARALALGLVIGIVMVIFQWPISQLSFHLLGLGSQASAQTFHDAEQYFNIRIWGAPFALATYACLGWLTARGRTDLLMISAVATTMLNAVLDIIFVLHFDKGVAGIALGTLIAEVAGFLISAWFVARILSQDGLLRTPIDKLTLLNKSAMSRMATVNADIFIRTLLLAFSFSWFIQRGSAFGDVVLAANQLLLQLFLFTGLALDGSAIAAETLVGRVMGERDKRQALERYSIILRRGFVLASAGAVLFSLVYLIAGDQLIRLLTDSEQISASAIMYMPWVIVSPFVVMVCFQLDGIFVGATRSRAMRDTMIISVIVFVPLSLWLAGLMGNHGLWLAFMMYFLARGITLAMALPGIKKAIISPANS